MVPVTVDPQEAAVVAALIVPVEKPPALPDVEDAVAAPTPASPPGVAQPGTSTEAMQPAAPRKATRTIQKTKPTRRLEPGDLVCGECGEGNPPARKFCSRCGESLASAATVKRKWWKRLWPQKKVKTLEVGERPGQAGVKAKRKWGRSSVTAIRKVVTVVAIVVAFAIGLVPSFRDWANETVLQPIKDKWNGITTQSFEPVNPNTSIATAETPDHPASNAIDLAGNTFWVSPAAAGEPVLVVAFAQPVDLDRAIVQDGARDQFSAFSRASKLHLVFSTGKSSDINLKDSPEQQKVDIHNGHGITQVEIHVTGTYQAIGNPDVALTEIELFKEK